MSMGCTYLIEVTMSHFWCARDARSQCAHLYL